MVWYRHLVIARRFPAKPWSEKFLGIQGGYFMRSSRILQTAVAVLFCLLVAGPAHSSTINIPADYLTIAEGLAAAEPGDLVLVASGIYLEQPLVMSVGVYLRGATGDPADVVIDAQRLGPTLTCYELDDPVWIEDLTLTGGYTTIENSGSQMGGGLYVRSTYAEVRNCRFIDNEAEMEGGGLAFDLGSNGLISGCLVAGNIAIDGPGISCRASSPLVENCVIANNDGLVWGGALFCRTGANPRVVGCTLVGNDAHFGAGIWAVDGPNIVVENSIIAFGVHGEGIFAYDNPSYPSDIRLICCNVYGNQGGGFGGTSPDQIGIDGNIAVDPLFCDVENLDFTLAADSPCLPENNSCNMQIGALGQGCNVTSGVNDGLPSATRLVQNMPNPFNPQTEITFELAHQEAVTLIIFDASGRRVRDLIAGEVQSAGDHHVIWNGRDDSGREVPSGIYLYRLTSSSGVETKKMTLAK
jgi:hypothetical protein